MTKNEFDILNYVSLHPHASLSDLFDAFKKAFNQNFVMLELVIIHLHQLGYLESSPVSSDSAQLDPHATFTLTPTGAHAMDEYSETTSRLDRAEASANEANKLSHRSNIIAAVAAFIALLPIIGAAFLKLSPILLDLWLQLHIL